MDADSGRPASGSRGSDRCLLRKRISSHVPTERRERASSSRPPARDTEIHAPHGQRETPASRSGDDRRRRRPSVANRSCGSGAPRMPHVDMTIAVCRRVRTRVRDRVPSDRVTASQRSVTVRDRPAWSRDRVRARTGHHQRQRCHASSPVRWTARAWRRSHRHRTRFFSRCTARSRAVTAQTRPDVHRGPTTSMRGIAMISLSQFANATHQLSQRHRREQHRRALIGFRLLF